MLSFQDLLVLEVADKLFPLRIGLIALLYHSVARLLVLIGRQHRRHLIELLERGGSSNTLCSVIGRSRQTVTLGYVCSCNRRLVLLDLP